MSMVPLCQACDTPVPPHVKRYQITEEYPRVTLGYFCGKCWRIIKKIASK